MLENRPGKQMVLVNVYIWDQFVGTVAWNPKRQVGTFEFDSSFTRQGIDLAPLTMPLEDIYSGERIYEFPGLNKDVFHGLPGLLSDSLPDAFGNEIFRAWILRQGKDLRSVSPVEKLSYIGSRGMGALRFEPSMSPETNKEDTLELQSLLDLTSKLLMDRESVMVNLSDDEEAALSELIKIGTSAGGQRAKAIIAFNPETNEMRFGQLDLAPDFEHYILKFDGVTSNTLGDPEGYGRIEMAYCHMAMDCGIRMSLCRLLEENGRAHFMTQRFDRRASSERIHMQTLCAMAHYDYHQPGQYSYDEALADMRDLYLPYNDMEQMFRRMIFNVVARNQDDHTKNISFLLPENGQWKLSPAYDVNWSYNPDGVWTSLHQMNISGKRSHFVKNELVEFGERNDIDNPNDIVEEIIEVVSNWSQYAKNTCVDDSRISLIGKTHRLRLDGSS